MHLHVYRYLSFINNVSCKDSFEDCVFHVRNQLGMCTAFHSSRCWGHAVWTLVSATCSHMHLTVTSMVGAHTVRRMEESVGFPLAACAAARSRVACRWGILPITFVTCLGVGSVRVGIRFPFLYQPVTIKR